MNKKSISILLIIVMLFTGNISNMCFAAAEASTLTIFNTNDAEFVDKNKALLISLDYYTYLVDGKGDLWRWGAGNYIPVQANIHDIVDFASSDLRGYTFADRNGYAHCLILKKDGTVWGWGDNTYGQLGINISSSTKYFDSPQQIDIQDVIDVETGVGCSLALKKDGTVWVWGQIPYKDTNGSVATRYTHIPEKLELQEIAKIYGKKSGRNFFATDIYGNTYAWGGDLGGSLGLGVDGDYIVEPTLLNLPNIIDISDGSTSTIFLCEDGTVWQTGYFQDYGSWPFINYVRSKIPVKINIDDVVKIGSGTNHYFAIKSDGTLWGWGENDYGEVGTGNNDNRFVGMPNPNTTDVYPEKIENIDNVEMISGGKLYTIAIKKDGIVLSWGNNYSGVLGQGLPEGKLVLTPGLINLKAFENEIPPEDDLSVVEKDYLLLKVGYSEGDNSTSVKKDLTLPQYGVQGSTITWTSSDGTVIDSSGKVIRPKEDTKVILRAQIAYGEDILYKEFPMIVKAGETGNSDYLHNGVKPEFLEYKWDKKGLFGLGGDDLSKPPIDVIGSDDDYIAELKNWAEYYGIDNVTNADSKLLSDILKQKVSTLAVDTSGQEWLIKSQERTIKDLIKDIVYIDGVYNYLNKLDDEFISKARTDFIIKPYSGEKEVYKKYIGYMDQIGEYIRKYSKYDSIFSTLLAPLSWKSIIALNNGSYSFINPVAKASFKTANQELVLRTATLSATNEMREFKENSKAISEILGTGKAIFEFKSNGGGIVGFASDLFDVWASKIPVVGEFYSDFKGAYDAAKLSMSIGSSIGLFPYVVDLYFDMEVQAEETLKAWYFFSDYYIRREYPNLYNDIIGESITVKEEVNFYDGLHDGLINYYYTLGNGSSAGRNEYMNNINNPVIQDWEGYLNQGFDNVYGVKYVNNVDVRRKITNAATLYNFINHYKTGEAKYNLVKFISAELNKLTTTEIKVDCPVIVKVYDKNGALLEILSPENDRPIQSVYGSFYLMGDNKESKYLIINSDEYYFEIIPYDSGSMNILVFRNENGTENATYYKNVLLEPDMVFAGQNLDDGKFELTKTQSGVHEIINPEDIPPLLSISINNVKKDMNIGETQKMDIEIKPVSYTGQLVFNSTNSDIVSVDSSGNLTALSAGSCNIIVSSSEDNLIFDEVSVQVRPSITAFNIEKTQYQLNFGESINLEIDVDPVSEIDNIVWRSVDSNVAYVDGENVLHGLNPGETNVKGLLYDKEVELYVKVEESIGSSPAVLSKNYNFTFGLPQDITIPFDKGSGDLKAETVLGLFRMDTELYKAVDFETYNENIVLKKEYLNSLSEGNHKFIVLFDDLYETESDFTVTVSKSSLSDNVRQVIEVLEDYRQDYTVKLNDLLPIVDGTFGEIKFSPAITENNSGLLGDLIYNDVDTTLVLPVNKVSGVGKTAEVTITVESTNYQNFNMIIVVRTTAKQTTSDGGSSLPGKTDDFPSKGDYTPNDKSSDTWIDVSGNIVIGTITVKATIDSKGNAMGAFNLAQINDAIEKMQAEAKKLGKGSVTRLLLKVDVPENIAEVQANISKEAIIRASEFRIDYLVISTPVASVIFELKTLLTLEEEAADDIIITMSRVDNATLPTETQQLVGYRPVFDFNVLSGDKEITQFGGYVTVTVPYTPKEGEDINAIVIYYINAEGKPEIVSNCTYDPATGTVCFTVNHFSKYAVGYNKVNFNDVPENAWYSKAVAFISARRITAGTGNGRFSPESKLTRAQFLVMLMKAYGIDPDTNPTVNFDDAGNAYYTGYIAAAKRLGITSGIGNNMFGTQLEITRQEMFTLLYRILKLLERLPGTVSDKNLESFSDAGDLAPWAKEAMAYLVEAGIIKGNGSILNPTGTATRAEMAQVLYNLLSK